MPLDSVNLICSFSPFSNLSRTVPRAQAMIGITVTFIYFTLNLIAFLLLDNFSHQCKLMVFPWSLSDSKSPQISWTLLSILADLNNAVVWTVFTHPIISKSSSPCTNHLVTVLRAPITFNWFFNSLARSGYLSLFSHSFNFTLWSVWTAKSIIL